MLRRPSLLTATSWACAFVGAVLSCGGQPVTRVLGCAAAATILLLVQSILEPVQTGGKE